MGSIGRPDARFDCSFCQKSGHRPCECPQRWHDTVGVCLPGFGPTGNRIKRLWVDHEPTPASMLLWVQFLKNKKIFPDSAHTAGFSNSPSLQNFVDRARKARFGP